MADVEVNITVTDVSYRAWLRSSYISTGIPDDNGNPAVNITELGPDQLDAFTDFMEESTREVAKLFISRQGDVSGTPFEYDGTNAIYRFNEGEPVLPQAAAIKSTLTEDVKNALFCYTTFLWFNLKGNEDASTYLNRKYNSILRSITGSLYRLHD